METKKSEELSKKISDVCEAVKAKGGDCLVFSVTKAGDGKCEVICEITSTGLRVAYNLARVANKKGGEGLRKILETTHAMLDFVRSMNEEPESVGITEETTEGSEIL